MTIWLSRTWQSISSHMNQLFRRGMAFYRVLHAGRLSCLVCWHFVFLGHSRSTCNMSQCFHPPCIKATVCTGCVMAAKMSEFCWGAGVSWTRGSQPVSNTKLPCQPRARKSFHRTLVAHTTSERCGVVRRIRTCGRLNLNSKSAGGFQMWDNSSRPKSFSTKVATRKQMSAHQKCFVSNNYGCDAKQLAFPHNCHVDLFLAVLIQKQWLWEKCGLSSRRYHTPAKPFTATLNRAAYIYYLLTMSCGKTSKIEEAIHQNNRHLLVVY